MIQDTGDKILELIDISLRGRGGRSVFENLNFSLARGETAVITGPTGAGKTSLAELIIGARKPDSGTIIVFGRTLKIKQYGLLSRVRRQIGGVGGLYSLVASQTVRENLLNPLILDGDSVSAQKLKMQRVLTRFNLTERQNEPAGNLSQGERMVVMLARAIIADQPFLLIDEPLVGVDSDKAGELLEILKRLAVAGHSMIIFTSRPRDLAIPQMTEYTLRDGRLT